MKSSRTDLDLEDTSGTNSGGLGLEAALIEHIIEQNVSK